MGTVLSVKNLRKEYPKFTLDNISFEIEEGTIMGLIGRNGAGKTTTIKSILNLIHTSGGDIAYFGMNLADHEAEIKQQIGYAGGAVDYYKKKKIKKIIAVTKTFYSDWDDNEYRKYLELFELDEDKTPSAETDLFLPGAEWLDESGNTIQAHGGQIRRMPVPDGETVRERYVWVGENKSNGHFGNPVAVYVSDDLHRWEFMGDVLKPPAAREDLDNDSYFTAIYDDCTPEEKDLIYSCFNAETVIERPKMLYNSKTGQYVIWFHSDDATQKNTYKYDVGMAGVAMSDSPFGPFRFLRRQRLSLCPKGQIDCFPASKGEARDMNLFLDSDGTAYIVYTSENNKTLYISKLDESYLNLSVPPEDAVYGEDYIRLFPSAMREAPVLFRGDNGRYYLLSSSTTGWMSNQARLWSSDQIFGKWKNDGNPFRGSGANLSFDTQCTSVFRREDGQWIYYGDRWKQSNLADSRYIWLPLQFEENRIRIEWLPEWK